MTTNSARLMFLIALVGTALWSIMRLSSWAIVSAVGYLLAIYEACQVIELKKSTQNIEYNLMNYPDEISVNF